MCPRVPEATTILASHVVEKRGTHSSIERQEREVNPDRVGETSNRKRVRVTEHEDSIRPFTELYRIEKAGRFDKAVKRILTRPR